MNEILYPFYLMLIDQDLHEILILVTESINDSNTFSVDPLGISNKANISSENNDIFFFLFFSLPYV